MPVDPVRVLVWDEAPAHAPKSIYPASINGAVAEGVVKQGGGHIVARCANLDHPEQGCGEDALASTDVLVWWGHLRHAQVTDETADRVVRHVRERGMGLVALHSAHHSKVFKRAIEGTGDLNGGWRETDPLEKEAIRIAAPWHPIAEGIGDFVLDGEEMYGAPFDVPAPLVMVLQSHFPLDGKTFPSGLCWTVGAAADQGQGCGRVFYFRPGHETAPTYHVEPVQKVLANAILWCAKRS